MLSVHRLHGPSQAPTRASAKPLYEGFCERSAKDYGWEFEPLAYDLWADALAHTQLQGYLVTDTSLPNPAGSGPKPVAMMLYTPEAHEAIEINLLFNESTDAIDLDGHGREKAVLDAIMRVFLADLAQLSGWKTVSFPMLGHQAKFVRSLTWYRFRAMGQAIVEIDFTNPVSTEVIQKQTFAPLPEGYTLMSWDAAQKALSPETLHHQAAQCIADSFVKSSDALWDPRFQTLDGANSLVNFIIRGQMGEHWPECTQVLVHQQQLVGFCFVIASGLFHANVPLVGVSPTIKRKGLGTRLLYTAMMSTVKQVITGHRVTQSVSATLDTDNLAAIHMYRRLGFIERTYYPHAYLTRERWATWQANQWCNTGVTHQPDPSRPQVVQSGG
jgi:ribosomal protein S18 acetylase RimI-like enzyme